MSTTKAPANSYPGRPGLPKNASVATVAAYDAARREAGARAMKPAVQLTDTFTTEAEATTCLAALSLQMGHLGGRVLAPCATRRDWLVQGFMDADGVTAETWLPDGMRFVFVPHALAQQCGFPG